MSETAIYLAEFALGLNSSQFHREQPVENGKSVIGVAEEIDILKNRIIQLVEQLNHLEERYEDLKSFLYDGDK